MNIQKLSDIIAIPFFLSLAIYFYKREHKTPLENVFYVFAIVGFIVDASLTALFIKGQCRKLCRVSTNNSK